MNTALIELGVVLYATSSVALVYEILFPGKLKEMLWKITNIVSTKT